MGPGSLAGAAILHCYYGFRDLWVRTSSMAPPSYALLELPFPTLTPLVDVFLQLSSFCLPVHLFNY